MTPIVENLVSTIIPTFNRPQMLQEAVASVLAQTWRAIEIIISDDGSTDETPALGRALEKEHPGVIRYIWNNNRGAGPAREAGRLLARGEFIQYLDSDDTLWPRKFEVQIQALRQKPECGAAYGWIRLCPEDGLPIEKPHKWSGRELPTLFPRLLADRWWNTDCPLFRRSVCDAVGPWSDLRYSQDWEYDGRVGALGTRLVHCKEFVCDQRHHSENRQTMGRWLDPVDRVRFFNSLYDSAMKAGVTQEDSELLHFSRWMFLNARESGILGDALSAKQLINLAVQANIGASIAIKCYLYAANIFGWKPFGLFTEKIRSIVKREPGKHTLKQSWMESDFGKS